MRRRKKRQSEMRFYVEEKNSPNTFFRLCHRCLFLNESEKYIEKCHRCERQFIELKNYDSDQDSESSFDFIEDPIEQALSDFETDNPSNESGEKIRALKKEGVQEDDTSDEEEEQEQEEDRPTQRVRSISGLNVIW